MANEQEKQYLAETFLTGLRSRDWDLMRSIMTDDIVCTLPGNSRISGAAQGKEAVIERARIIVSYGLTFTLKHILIGQYGLTLSLNNTATHGDRRLDEHLATVCSLRDGRISVIDTYLSDVAMADAFFV